MAKKERLSVDTKPVAEKAVKRKYYCIEEGFLGDICMILLRLHSDESVNVTRFNLVDKWDNITSKTNVIVGSPSTLSMVEVHRTKSIKATTSSYCDIINGMKEIYEDDTLLTMLVEMAFICMNGSIHRNINDAIKYKDIYLFRELIGGDRFVDVVLQRINLVGDELLTTNEIMLMAAVATEHKDPQPIGIVHFKDHYAMLVNENDFSFLTFPALMKDKIDYDFIYRVMD